MSQKELNCQLFIEEETEGGIGSLVSICVLGVGMCGSKFSEWKKIIYEDGGLHCENFYLKL